MFLYRILIDFGLLILIWLVQLIIYPSFIYLSESNFKVWHKKYTFMISLFVVPLMLGQLAIILSQVIFDFSLITLFSISLVAVAWISTFLQAIPLHNEMDQNLESNLYRRTLIRINWIRTFSWTSVFILGLIDHLLSNQEIFSASN